MTEIIVTDDDGNIISSEETTTIFISDDPEEVVVVLSDTTEISVVTDSVQGMPGPQGLTGPQGDPGDFGATGATGPQGETGAGETGATGPTGETGPQGPTGISSLPTLTKKNDVLTVSEVTDALVGYAVDNSGQEIIDAVSLDTSPPNLSLSNWDGLPGFYVDGPIVGMAATDPFLSGVLFLSELQPGQLVVGVEVTIESGADTDLWAAIVNYDGDNLSAPLTGSSNAPVASWLENKALAYHSANNDTETVFTLNLSAPFEVVNEWDVMVEVLARNTVSGDSVAVTEVRWLYIDSLAATWETPVPAVVKAAAILLTPSLTPEVGDEIWTVTYSPGAEETDWTGGWVAGNNSFSKVTSYEYSGLWEADPEDVVLLMIDEGPGGQQDYWPSTYARFTGTGFEPIAVSGGTLVSLSCGGAGFGVPSIFVGANTLSPTFGGTWPLADAEYFQPHGTTASEVVTRYNYTGNLDNTNNLQQALDAIDGLTLTGGATGPQGETGPIGETGPQGETGASGSGETGPTGPQGETGATGDGFYWSGVYNPSAEYVSGSVVSGSDGNLHIATSAGFLGDPATGANGWNLYLPKGDAGETGPTGPQGETGPSGSDGATGPVGETGATGSGFYWLNTYVPGNGYVPGAIVKGSNDNLYIATGSGALGDPATGSSGWDLYLPKGDQGYTGPTGETGPSGNDGATGPQGETGPTGPMPYNYRGLWSGATVYSLYDAVTFEGSLWWLPSTAGWTIGGYPPGYNWELIVSSGYTGPIGETGPVGETGPQGETGASGGDGWTGPQGETGPIGETGPQGETGATGSTGPKGELAGLSWTYQINTSTSGDRDPGNDNLGFVTLPYYNATQIVVDDNPYGINTTLHELFLNVQSAYLTLTSQSDPYIYATWKVTSCVDGTVDNETVDGSYVIFNVDASNMGYGSFTNGELVTLSLSIIGSQGATGPSGPQGATGSVGETGSTGPQGATGVTGATGPQGATGAANSQNVHDSVYVATTTVLPNSPTYTAGTIDANGGYGIGATLTSATNSTLTVDSTVVPVNSRVLVKDQADPKRNGIYKLTTAGGAVPWVLTRATDYDNHVSADVNNGDYVLAINGTTNTGTTWMMSAFGSGTGGNIVIGTDNITFTRVSGVGPQGATGATGAGGTIGYWGSWWDTTTQRVSAINTKALVTYDTIGAESGITIENGSEITFAHSGVYNIQFSAQLHNEGGGGNGVTARIWLSKNGVDVAESAGTVNVPSNNPYVVTAWNYVFDVTAGDYFEIAWATDNTHIVMLTNTSAAPAPTIPSIIITATQVTYTQIGPSGPTGPQGATGVQGATGSAGTNGTNGTQGFTGATGPAGSNGSNGSAGTTGPTGATGPGVNELPLTANDYMLLSHQHGNGYTTQSTGTSATNSNNAVRYIPFYIGKQIGTTALAVYCTALNAGASAVVRIGIYNDNSGRPGTVKTDAGTVSVNATGVLTKTFTEVTLTPGWYWAAIATQSLDTAGANPTFATCSVAAQIAGETTPAASNNMFSYFTSSSISGAFADNPTVALGRTVTGNVFHVWMKVSTP